MACRAAGESRQARADTFPRYYVPMMDNLAAIFDAIRKCLKVGLKAHTVNLQRVE